MSINDFQKVILKTWHLGKLVLIDSIPGREKEATSENVCHWKLLETFQLYCSIRLSPMLLPSPTLTESLTDMAMGRIYHEMISNGPVLEKFHFVFIFQTDIALKWVYFSSRDHWLLW